MPRGGAVVRSESAPALTAALGSALVLLSAVVLPASAQAGAARHRLIILADMGNEPDEMQQMAHMLVYANEFDLEGLVAVTGKYLRKKPRPKLFHKLIDGYAEVLGSLRKHASGWPSPDHLHGITVAGQYNYGMADVGEGKPSAGSELIVRSVLKEDPRPVNVVVNAGSNTLAQALWDYRSTHARAEADRFVARLRVYENGAQDNAGAWICHEFPKVHWVRSNRQTYAYGGPDFDGKGKQRKLGPHTWGPHPYTPAGQHAWAREHVQTGHGPLGALYPDRRFGRRMAYLEGGGTTPWIGLVNKGVYDPDRPSWGGWGGRFTATRMENVWSRHKDVRRDEEKHAPFQVYDAAVDSWTDPHTGKKYEDVHAAVWRWRRAMFDDFRARMDWCVKGRGEANHNPVAAFRGDATSGIVRLAARAGETVALDASGSRDPDGDGLRFSWYVYPEAGTHDGELGIADDDSRAARLVLPADAAGSQVHVILRVSDDSKTVSLSDYRRIVIDVAPARR
jgi:hypothetical protein